MPFSNTKAVTLKEVFLMMPLMVLKVLMPLTKKLMIFSDL